jgi:hypothetical protein
MLRNGDLPDAFAQAPLRSQLNLVGGEAVGTAAAETPERVEIMRPPYCRPALRILVAGPESELSSHGNGGVAVLSGLRR